MHMAKISASHFLSTSIRKKLVRTIYAAVATVVITSGIAQANENKLKLEYDFLGASFRVLKVTFDLSFDGKSYLVKSQVSTKGVANLFTRSVSYFGARGAINSQNPQPQEFQSRTESSKGQKTAQIIWAAKKQQQVNTVPQPNEFRLAAVEKVLKPNFPDPLTALVSIAFSNDKLCRRNIRSFDGRKVFDFKLTYIGKEILRKGDAGSYSGPAYKCQFKNIPIAGYSKKKMKNYRAKPTPAYTLWFAPIKSAKTGKTIYIPVKAVGTINWATVTALITSGTLNGQQISASQHAFNN